MSKYSEQAEQFLKETNTEMKIKFLKHGLHFIDDKEERDIYRVTIKRGEKKFSVKFGQSIADTGKEPSAYDILACLTKNNPETFESFCSEFGYDTDSKKAEKTYKAVVKEWEGVSEIWNTEEIEELQEIQ